MKALKITLVIISILLISILGYFSFNKGPEKTNIPNTTSNKFVNLVKEKIDFLSRKSLNEFCVSYYNEIKNDIEIYTSKNKIDEEWKEYLLKNLEYTYTPIFIKQAYNVYESTYWEYPKRAIIWSEADRLSNSNYIEDKNELVRIKSIMIDFWVRYRFIKKSNDFAMTDSINSFDQDFNIDSAKYFIKKANNYYSTNTYVSNVTHLQNQLQNVPLIMYKKHLNYLSNKVRFCKGKYSTMESYTYYFNTILQKIYLEIEFFEDNRSIYSVSIETMNTDLESIIERVKQDKIEAESFIYPSKRDTI